MLSTGKSYLPILYGLPLRLFHEGESKTSLTPAFQVQVILNSVSMALTRALYTSHFLIPLLKILTLLQCLALEGIEVQEVFAGLVFHI